MGFTIHIIIEDTFPVKERMALNAACNIQPFSLLSCYPNAQKI
ncbi:hypothetical protein ACFL40_02640 [candidate division KSB1 bacterium]